MDKEPAYRQQVGAATRTEVAGDHLVVERIQLRDALLRTDGGVEHPAGAGPAGPYQQIVLPTRMIIRSSCGARRDAVR